MFIQQHAKWGCPSARNFIRRCLTIEPNERVTARDALKDPWFFEEPTAVKTPAEAGLLDLLTGIDW